MYPHPLHSSQIITQLSQCLPYNMAQVPKNTQQLINTEQSQQLIPDQTQQIAPPKKA